MRDTVGGGEGGMLILHHACRPKGRHTQSRIPSPLLYGAGVGGVVRNLSLSLSLEHPKRRKY